MSTSSNDNAPLLRSTTSRRNSQHIDQQPSTGLGEWWRSRSRDALSLFSLLLLLGIGLGIWVYGTLPTSDQDENPHEYALSTDRIYEHLIQLQTIASQHNNSRSVATGHKASAEYVIEHLKEHGNCDVYVQRFVSPVWTLKGTPRLGVRGDVKLDYIWSTDFQVLRYGGQGADIKEAPAVEINGCKHLQDVDGKVAVVQSHAGCTSFELAYALEQKGAKAVLFIMSPRFKTPSRARVRLVDWKEGDPLMTIPVLSATSSVGQLLQSLGDGALLNIHVDSSIKEVKTHNVICVGRTGDPNNTIVVGSHLDSVSAGPGLNDNGSGSMSTLEIQLTLARIAHKPHNRLVFAWWAAEEDGLLGSRHFARVLAHGWENRWSKEDKLPFTWKDIALNLNFDMLASPNYIALVHNGSDAPKNARLGSQRIQRVFEDYFVRHGYPYQITDMLAGSDFLPFVDNGVPAGGVLTGASEIKSIEDRRVHGGLANAPLDTCYHQDCDTLLNINRQALTKMSKAAMYAVSTLSSMRDLREELEKGMHSI
ncbi:hypothetical protein GGI07_005150 [Coemansia sp. Benny D115]|nr:hypothetical protein GGI07_005150 [Coemansia sp. Benny D115]